MGPFAAIRSGLCLAFVLLSAGCATVPYRPGREIDYVRGYALPDNEPQIVQGRPHRLLDACDWIWPGSLLAKLMLWNAKIDSHQISPGTIEAVERYLERNELRDVKVRVNAYSVVDELRRTHRNKSVGFGWRYTLGIGSWIAYTLFPGRVFGGDHYNPYSNTIHLYSDLVPVGLHEAGHAKDFARRTWKGTYSAGYAFIPFFNLVPEALASADALGYLADAGDVPTLQSGYRLLYPAYGSYVGADVSEWVAQPWNLAVQVGAVLAGHAAGRAKAASLRDPPPLSARQSAPVLPDDVPSAAVAAP